MPTILRSKAFKYALAILVVYSALLLFDLYTNHQHIGTVCVFKNLTGIPCAGCGLGRGTISFFYGNFKEAFHFHILAIPLTIIALVSFVWLSYDGLKNKETFLPLVNSLITWKVFLFFIVLMLFSWYINIVRGV